MTESLFTDSEGTVHGSFQLATWIRGTLLGEVTFDPGSTGPALSYMRQSRAYFCPDCGEIWARLVVSEVGQPEPFICLTQACREHLDQWETPGSLIPLGQEALIALLPPAAIKREFELELKQWTIIQGMT